MSYACYNKIINIHNLDSKNTLQLENLKWVRKLSYSHVPLMSLNVSVSYKTLNTKCMRCSPTIMHQLAHSIQPMFQTDTLPLCIWIERNTAAESYMMLTRKQNYKTLSLQ